MDKRSINSELISKIRQADNILLTVSENPTVDDLVAMSGLWLGLRQLEKRVTNLFSGVIPDKIRFLGPQFSQTTNELRNFIISLDSSKVKKIQTKDEDNISKVYITPKSEIFQDDLKFELGELETDLVLVIGANNPNDLDKSVINVGIDPSKVVFLNLVNTSSFSEMVAGLLIDITEVNIRTNIANYLLTGIIVATEQFGNDKTTAKTFQVAAKMLKFGADQQLIVDNLRNTPIAAPQFSSPLPVDNAKIITTEPTGLITENENNYNGLDLTIPPAPVIKSKPIIEPITEKLPRPREVGDDIDIDSNLIMNLPPPPPMPDIYALGPPPSVSFSSTVSQPAVIGQTNDLQKQDRYRTSDPNQFQIPI